jgi:uncharacterized membrane protein YcaP (DUF421 family)
VLTDWLTTSWEAAGLILLSTVLIFVAVLVATRITGLRSFSKMSSFDFAMTVAVGSLMASTALTGSTPVLAGVVGLVGLYGFQWMVAQLRQRSNTAGGLIDNTPTVLMVGPTMLRDHLRAVRVTESDVRAKLREANVLQYEQVHAVVLETTGDISVLHGDGPLDPDLLRGVRGGELLADRASDPDE